MAYTSPHNLLVIYGTLNAAGTGADIWQTTCRFLPPEGAEPTNDPAAIVQAVDDIASALTTWWNALAARFATTTRLDGFKFNAIGTDGLYVSPDQTVQFDFPLPLAGSSNTPSLPFQISEVVTLHTAAHRGLASKGRMYMPPFVVGQCNTGGLIFEQGRGELQVATAALLEDLNGASPDIGRAAVMSKVREGDSNVVTGVTVGGRFDVQRRRANKIPEVRAPQTPVTAGA